MSLSLQRQKLLFSPRDIYPSAQNHPFQLQNDLDALSILQMIEPVEFFYHSDNSEKEEHHPNPFRSNKKTRYIKDWV